MECSSDGSGTCEEPAPGRGTPWMNRPAPESPRAPVSASGSKAELSGSDVSAPSAGGGLDSGVSFHSSVGTARTPTLSGALERNVVRPRVAGGNIRSSSSSEYGFGPAGGLGESTEVEGEVPSSSMLCASEAGRIAGAGPSRSSDAIAGGLPKLRSRVGIATRFPVGPGEYAARRYVP